MKQKEWKKAVRARMEETGETYRQAARSLQKEREAAEVDLSKRVRAQRALVADLRKRWRPE